MNPDPKVDSLVLGSMITDAKLACGSVVQNYAAPAFAGWRAITTTNVSDALAVTIAGVQDGDMSALEAMLVSQAVALQSMFVDLANRARGQKQREAVSQLTTLALKAQSQSRATIQALAEMKAPRTTAFVKQTNIAHGAQQVNNGTAPSGPPAPARARETKRKAPNKLIANADNGETILDTRATAIAGRGDSKAQTLVAINRSEKSERTRRRG